MNPEPHPEATQPTISTPVPAYSRDAGPGWRCWVQLPGRELQPAPWAPTRPAARAAARRLCAQLDHRTPHQL